MTKQEALKEIVEDLMKKEINYSFTLVERLDKNYSYIQVDDIVLYINNLIRIEDVNDITFKENEMSVDDKIYVKYEDIEMLEVR